MLETDYRVVWCQILHFVDHASLHNLVNKANLVHNLYLEYLLLVLLSICTCFGQLHVHHQEKQLCLCDTWYLSFCVDDCHSTLHTRQSSTQNDKYQVSHKHSCFSWWWARSRPIHVEIDKCTKNKYTKNKLCTKLALFTRWCGVISHTVACESVLP